MKGMETSEVHFDVEIGIRKFIEWLQNWKTRDKGFSYRTGYIQNCI